MNERTNNRRAFSCARAIKARIKVAETRKKSSSVAHMPADATGSYLTDTRQRWFVRTALVVEWKIMQATVADWFWEVSQLLNYVFDYWLHDANNKVLRPSIRWPYQLPIIWLRRLRRHGYRYRCHDARKLKCSRQNATLFPVGEIKRCSMLSSLALRCNLSVARRSSSHAFMNSDRSSA